MGDNKADALRACDSSSYIGYTCKATDLSCNNMHNVYYVDIYVDGYHFIDKGTAKCCTYLE